MKISEKSNQTLVAIVDMKENVFYVANSMPGVVMRLHTSKGVGRVEDPRDLS